MNKQELIVAISEKTGLSKKEAQSSIEATMDVIKEEINKGEKIQLIGFGNFEPKLNKARTGVNPATGEKIQIKESKSARFKVGKGFKDFLN
ncbi:MAG: HU family DNA-binding protein [Mycoplasmatales bacterium]